MKRIFRVYFEMALIALLAVAVSAPFLCFWYYIGKLGLQAHSGTGHINKADLIALVVIVGAMLLITAGQAVYIHGRNVERAIHAAVCPCFVCRKERGETQGQESEQ